MYAILLQAAILILTLAILYSLIHRPKFIKHRTKTKTTVQSTRHLNQAANFLSRAKSRDRKDKTLTKSALHEADQAISISPRDPKPLIVKAMALEIVGRESSALRSLDLALAVPRVKALAEKERGEALVKRAELKMKVNLKRRVDSAIEDLEEGIRVLSRQEKKFDSVGLGLGLCLLGECYEYKGVKEKAQWAFEEALKIEPDCLKASQGLDRL
ncbi:hypothetical protein ACFE04_016813 [Oxalis oulophora]